jgi:hypothetical protein
VDGNYNDDSAGLAVNICATGLTCPTTGGATYNIADGDAAGLIAAIRSANPVTTDQRGVSRPQGSACTIGSVEYSALYHVCLLYDPTKAVPSGATGPIKLQLCDSSGNDVSSSTIILHATASLRFRRRFPARFSLRAMRIRTAISASIRALGPRADTSQPEDKRVEYWNVRAELHGNRRSVRYGAPFQVR